MRITVKTFQGLEDILAKEVEDIGGWKVEKLRRAVSFEGNTYMLYKANYMLRTALRVLVPIFEFKIHEPEHLYKKALKFPWKKYIDLKTTFAIDFNIYSELYDNDMYASLQLKDAIVDYCREEFGDRPDVDPKYPDVRFNLFIKHREVVISLDSSGSSLNRRGYRTGTGLAPINEVLAAALLLKAGWHGQTDFMDPMCGSATFICEAGNIATNSSPFTPSRRFAFENWRNHDRAMWNKVRADVENNKKPFSKLLYASDIDSKILTIAKENIYQSGVSKNALVSEKDFFDPFMPISDVFVMMNPPYDKRIKQEEVNDWYKKIGDNLKKNYINSTVWIFSGNIEALKNVGLAPSEKYQFLNGKISSKLHKFDIYEGSKED